MTYPRTGSVHDRDFPPAEEVREQDSNRMLRPPVPPSVAANVRAFHHKFGVPVLDRPQVPSDERVRLRARLITEEYLETMRSLFAVNREEFDYFADAEESLRQIVDWATVRVDLPEAADGLADLIYVAEGSFLEMGIDSAPIHAEVQRSNLAKEGGATRADGKVTKPAGWTPPDIAGVLRAQGWEG